VHLPSPLDFLALFEMQAVTNKMLFALPDFMATNDKKSDNQRPRQLHGSKSFSRADPVPERLTRNQRASTIHNGIPEAAIMNSRSLSGGDPLSRRTPDAFERSSDDEEEDSNTSGTASNATEVAEELPIELASLSDRLVLEGRVSVSINRLQLYRIAVCQSPPNTTYCRQAFCPLPGFLRRRCNSHKHTHLRPFFPPTSRELTRTIDILTFVDC
jgi:hypothetical protein